MMRADPLENWGRLDGKPTPQPLNHRKATLSTTKICQAPLAKAPHAISVYQSLPSRQWRSKSHYQLSLEFHVERVAPEVLVEFPEFEQFRSVAHVLFRVVSAHTSSRTTCSRHTIPYHLPLLRTLQHHQFSSLLSWLSMCCHCHALSTGLSYITSKPLNPSLTRITRRNMPKPLGSRLMPTSWLPRPHQRKSPP